MAGQRVIVSVLADTREFSRSMNRLGDVTGFTKLRSKLRGVVTTLTRIVTVAGAAAVALGTTAVNAAANLEQSMGGVDAVFKDTADQMHDFASAADQAVGLSKNSYNELATVLGALLKNGGTSIDELGGKTNELITLGADMAAMFGGSTTDAVNALSSALKGERDPIEAYGVSLRQSAIDARAAEMGFEKVGGALSTEATQAATLSLIMEQTSDAHGAFSRESDTLQNKVQRTKAKLENMAATLGTYLVPIVGKVVDWFADKLEPALEDIQSWIQNTGIPWFNKLADVWKDDILPALKDVANWAKQNVLPVLKDVGNFVKNTLVPALKNAATWLKDNADKLIPLAAALGTAVVAWKAYNQTLLIVRTTKTAVKAAQVALNAVLKANPIGIVVTAIAALVAGLVTLYHSNEDVREIVDKVWNKIKEIIGGVIDWFTDTAIPAITGFIDGIGEAWENVKTWTSDAWNKVKTTISDAWESIKTGISDRIQSIKTSISDAWDKVKTTTSTAWTNIKTTVSDKITDLGQLIKDLPGNIKTWLGNMASLLVQKGKDTIQGLRDGINSKVETLSTWIGNLPTRIKNWLGNLGRTLWNAGRDLIQGFIDGISSMFTNVWNKLQELTTSLPNWKGPREKDKTLLKESGVLVIQGFIDGLESRYGAVRRSLAGFTTSLSGTVQTDLLPAANARLDLSTTGSISAAPVINVELHTLRPDVDTARAVSQALADYRRMTGRPA